MPHVFSSSSFILRLVALAAACPLALPFGWNLKTKRGARQTPPTWKIAPSKSTM
jgi:hypothetical protein